MKMGKLIAGKKYFPKPFSVTLGKDDIKGSTWTITKKDGKCTLEFIAARHGVGTDSYEISQCDYDAVRDGELSFEDLVRKYDLS